MWEELIPKKNITTWIINNGVWEYDYEKKEWEGK